MSAVTPQIGGGMMNSAKHYLVRLKRVVFQKDEGFAMEGGIFYGPGSDPKGSFYDPKLAINWYQPDSIVPMEEPGRERGLLKNWLTKLGSLRKSA
jgi:hypothetical protein